DNRDSSYDSRYWGFVGLDIIKGKAIIIYWSWDGDETRVRFNRIGRIIR
ncbi:MAG: S26 family signal peptidase, partial [Nitrospirota bacterium]|nr:S26 family signal peptidase [Nitrospirota bacterium]